MEVGVVAVSALGVTEGLGGVTDELWAANVDAHAIGRCLYAPYNSEVDLSGPQHFSPESP